MQVWSALLLGASAVLSLGAVLAFAWSAGRARLMLTSAGAASVAGGALGLVSARDALTLLALAAAWVAYGCDATACRLLRDQGQRWIHRFAIYAGYGATFAIMAAACLWLDGRAGGWTVPAVLVGLWLLGSGCTFAVKTAAVRFASKTRPEYAAALSEPPGDHGPSYW